MALTKPPQQTGGDPWTFPALVLVIATYGYTAAQVFWWAGITGALAIALFFFLRQGAPRWRLRSAVLGGAIVLGHVAIFLFARPPIGPITIDHWEVHKPVEKELPTINVHIVNSEQSFLAVGAMHVVIGSALDDALRGKTEEQVWSDFITYRKSAPTPDFVNHTIPKGQSWETLIGRTPLRSDDVSGYFGGTRNLFGVARFEYEGGATEICIQVHYDQKALIPVYVVCHNHSGPVSRWQFFRSKWFGL